MDRRRTDPGITEHSGIALGPAQTNTGALALIDQHPDGAVLNGNLLDGPITPVAHALCTESIPLLTFTGLGLRTDLARSHPDIPVILKPAPCETVIRATAECIEGHALAGAGIMPRKGLVPPPQRVIGRFPATESVGLGVGQNDRIGHPNPSLQPS